DEPHLDLLPQEDFIEAISTGDQELFQDAQYKRSAKCLERMDQVVKNLETSLYKARDLEFLGQTIMSKQEMEQSMTKDFAYMPLMPRAMRIKRVIINRLRNARNEKLYDINKKYQDLENRISAGEVLNEDTSISRWEEIRNLVRQVMEFREQITYLGKGNIRRLYMAQNTMRILTHEDLVPMLYLKNRLEGIKLGFEVRYLVIDEAQDLSLNHFKVLKDITKCHNATIVGDLNQRLIQWDEAGFLQLEEIYNDVTTFQLNKSYRSTDEIVKYADGFLKGTSAESLRSGDPVEVEETKNLKTAAVLIKERYEQMKKDGVESIAIITRNLDTAQDLNNLLKDEIYYKFIRTQDGIYSTNTLLLSAFLAKGLEFDGVIMVDTHRDREKPDLVKYIMSTRALHRLHVIETTA
ncbi:MAG: UvrD-helicase domain-containing protein, partial [Clostridium sp.]|nr:UvrD-helicase domain-containing protein [Clostridium sp.]